MSLKPDLPVSGVLWSFPRPWEGLLQSGQKTFAKLAKARYFLLSVGWPLNVQLGGSYGRKHSVFISETRFYTADSHFHTGWESREILGRNGFLGILPPGLLTS